MYAHKIAAFLGNSAYDKQCWGSGTFCSLAPSKKCLPAPLTFFPVSYQPNIGVFTGSQELFLGELSAPVPSKNIWLRLSNNDKHIEIHAFFY